MKQNEDTALSKRFSGPLETPTIFRDKWLSKFRQIFYITADNLTSSKDTPIYQGVILIEQYTHLQYFFLKARDLSLSRTDLPAEPLLSPSETHQFHGRMEEIIATLNPFEAATRFMTLTDVYLEKL